MHLSHFSTLIFQRISQQPSYHFLWRGKERVKQGLFPSHHLHSQNSVGKKRTRPAQQTLSCIPQWCSELAQIWRTLISLALRKSSLCFIVFSYGRNVVQKIQYLVCSSLSNPEQKFRAATHLQTLLWLLGFFGAISSVLLEVGTDNWLKAETPCFGITLNYLCIAI